MIPSLDLLGLMREAEDHTLVCGIPFTNPAAPPATVANPATESWDIVKRAIDPRIENAYQSSANARRQCHGQPLDEQPEREGFHRSRLPD
jgi:hypothetical protein